MKKIFLTALSALVALNLFGNTEPTTQSRKILPFNDNWKFMLSDNPDFKNTNFDDAAWRSIELPHDWSIEGAVSEKHNEADAFLPQGIGWYRKSFTVPDTTKRKYIIRFDGVYMNSDVWINGRFIGRYPFGYTTFQYDITEYLKTGADKRNVIAVRVDDSLYPTTRWYNGCGIYRNVWLISTNYVHFHNYKGVYVTTLEATEQKATVDVKYNFAAHYFPGSKIEWRPDFNNLITKEVMIRSTVSDAQGMTVAVAESKTTCTNTSSDNLLEQKIQVDNPALWSANSPITYYLKSEILVDNILVDDQITLFGIRKLEFIPEKGMYVNGKTEKLKGVCLHHTAASLGAAVPDGAWHYRLKKFKAMGCNAIRTSHNPVSPEFLTMCDTMGFYVMEEVFDEWTRDWGYNYTEDTRGKAKYGYHLYFKQWYETDLKSILWRDRNHPSMIMYSIGNEIPDQNNLNGDYYAKKMVDICHAEDPSRPATAGTNLEKIPNSNDGFLTAQDILGYNYIERVHPKEWYQGELKKYPDKLAVGTETLPNIDNFLAYRDHDNVLGEFIWNGIDYLGEGQKWPKRGFITSIMDMACGEKPGYYLRKCYWSDEPMTYIAALKKLATQKYDRMSAWSGTKAQHTWNWNKNDTIQLSVYTNCDEVELLLNNKSLGKKTVDKNLYTASWEIAYKPGALKSIAYNKGKKVAENVLTTSGDANQITAKANKTLFNAGKKEISIIEVSVCDQKGNPVFDADNEITVTVNGAAKLIGIDTGDIFYTGQFKTNKRKAYHGKILVTVESAGQAGTAQVNFQSENLNSCQLQFQTQ